MIKAMIALLLGLTIGVSASAETLDNSLFGEYVKCYYELAELNSSSDFTIYKSITFTPQEIKRMDKSFETKHDLYIFTSEGFYGINSGGLNKKYCAGCEPIENYSCAYNFMVNAGSTNYNLCYSKTWEGGDSCKETVLDGSCQDYDINVKNVKMLSVELKLAIKGQQLDQKYFYSMLYPTLQKMYFNLTQRYIWTSDMMFNICGNSDTNKKQMLIRDQPYDEESNKAFNARSKDRIKEINTIANGKACFPACKRIDKNEADNGRKSRIITIVKEEDKKTSGSNPKTTSVKHK